MAGHSTPGQLGRELRQGSGEYLRRRRGIVGLNLFSCAVLGGIALYQTGILKSLPGPRSRGFNAEKVNGSAQAYSILDVPDALLGLFSFAATACLAGMGPENRWRTHPAIPVGMGLKVLADAAFAGKLTLDECNKYHEFSPWSLLTAGAAFAALPLAVPEVAMAIRRLKRVNA
ncbi:MAG: vitamin K epoxide reductase family protein [Bryobacteraceae bacterium]